MPQSTRLAQCGEALYGSRWQSEMARALGVSTRTMRRWAAGTSPVPQSAMDDIVALMEDRIDNIRNAMGDLSPSATASRRD